VQSIETWKFLAGLGFFLYGMGRLEAGLKSVSGRSLKLFLRKHTKSLVKSIFGGAIITGLVQSSTVVSIIVLAFVESGIITFRNALGVLLGANIGTTLTGWILVLIGFKIDVLGYALPLIAVASIGSFLFESRKKVHNILVAFFSLGILFLGLGFMKEGAENLVKDFDLSPYAHYHSIIFVIIGLVLTTIIQSSSAMVALTLTSLHIGVISFPLAAAIVIGANIGTTITVLIVGLKGSADKKRTAYGNFIFNVFTSGIAYIFLYWFIFLITDVFKIEDSLIALVFFQTSINVFSVILFLPFISFFTTWLEKKIVSSATSKSSYISHDLSELPILANESMRKQALILLNKSLDFLSSMLCRQNVSRGGVLQNLKSFTDSYVSVDDEYNRLKQTEGDILGYYAKVQERQLAKEDAAVMLNYVATVRQCIYAAKAIKDISHNLQGFRASENDFIFKQVKEICKKWTNFSTDCRIAFHAIDKNNIAAVVEQKIYEINANEESEKSVVFNELKEKNINEIEASTLMNVFHELRASKKAILIALSHIEIESIAGTSQA